MGEAVEKGRGRSTVTGHWIVLVKGMLFITVGVLLGIGPSDFHAFPGSMSELMDTLSLDTVGNLVTVILSTAAILFGMLDVSLNLIWLATSRVTLSKDGIEWRTGFINQQIETISYARIESGALSRSILGRILGYGTIRLYGVGSGVITMPNLKQAEGLTRYINQRKRQTSNGGEQHK